MNTERLLQHYEQIADAPDAIARLRRFILDLAVRGKLVPQDPAEEPASELRAQLSKAYVSPTLEQWGRGRRSAIAAGLIEKPLFELPANWVWTPMGGLGETNIGLTYSPADLAQEGYPVLRSNNIQQGKIDLSDLVRVRPRPKDSVLVQVGDMLICARNGSRSLVGKAALLEEVTEPMAFGAFMAIFRSPLNRYLHLFVSSPAFRNAIDEVNTNTINQLTQGNLKSTLVPLPPLAEQNRIIAKVEDLMALCDALEAARTERETKRDRLAAASLARLNTPDPETFHKDACFALDALPALTARPDQIKQLRQTILNLAVRGKLSVHDDWVDKPVRVGDVATLQNGYAFKSEWFAKSGTRLVRNANVGHGKLNWAEAVCLPESRVPEFERFRLSEGDIVVSLDRPFIVTGTKVARISSNDLPVLLLQRVGRFVLTSKLCSDFLYLWINSPHFSEQIDPGRSNGVPHISSKQVESAAIFVPTLAEQHRIVAKVDELMALCDQLEASLTSADETRKKLLDALLAEALAPVNAEALKEAAE